jgi:hypothetical protein
LRDKNNNNHAPAHLTLLAIAASADFGYNSQPNQSIPSLFLGASAFIWLGIKKMGRCPFFFC